VTAGQPAAPDAETTAGQQASPAAPAGPLTGPGRPAVLIGPPAAGKSSVGALLAAELGVPFADTDELVARAARKPVGEVFVDDGEQVFRELERGAVAGGLDTVRAAGGVLAVGSGAVLDPDVRRMLAGQVIVYLEAEFATVAKRTGIDRPRVVIPGNPRGRLRAMLEERRPVYAELAALTVPTDDLAPEEVAADLAKRLRS
jgi:shikimate kinase